MPGCEETRPCPRVGLAARCHGHGQVAPHVQVRRPPGLPRGGLGGGADDAERVHLRRPKPRPLPRGGRAECGVPSSSPHFSKNRHPPRQHGPRGQPRRSTSGAWSTGWWTTTGASGAPSTKASGRPTHQRSTPPPRSALAASIQPALAPPSALFANQVTPHAIAPGSAARERRHAKHIDILQQCLDLPRK
jgi:hypothetical protein